ncbi:autotransporter outer membrane beta-barrel domain-containing protein [Microvirga sp. W0021]|uniref:Autotransporter outer membrane beta-barrel domain-containing protein n=1 Tax=Hohaiivirga grylli TaxID=3133970 RepID=A0ABV0BEW1_9HYPH
MNYKILGVSSLALLIAALSGGVSSASICTTGHTDIGLMDGRISNMTMDSTMCYELTAHDGSDGITTPYTHIATNVTIESGAILSVLGILNDSTAKSGSLLYATKDPRIAWDDYISGVPATINNTVIESGARIYALSGGTLQNSTVYGIAYISQQDTAEAGYGVNNTVGNGGVYYTYLNGQSQGTKVLSGGIEYVQQNGISTGSVITEGGAQYVRSSGTSTSATVENGGKQVVSASGVSNSAIINAGGVQNIYDSGTARGATVSGTQNIYMGTATAGAAYNTKLTESGSQHVMAGASAIDTELYGTSTQMIYVDGIAQNATAYDQSVVAVAPGARAQGVTSLNDQATLKLYAADTGGSAAENVVLNGESAVVSIVGGESNQSSVLIENLSGTGQVKFANVANVAPYGVVNIVNLSGNVQFIFRTSIAEGLGDYVNIQNGTGTHHVTVMDSGAEITSPISTSLDLITDASKGAAFGLVNLNGVNINAVDGGTYMYTLNNRDEAEGRIWYLGAYDVPKPDPGTKVDPDVDPVPSPAPQVTDLRTTPSTDALISMSVAPGMMFANELGNLRFRKGDLGFMSDSQRKGGVWARVIGSSATYSPSVAKFRMQQEGFEAGTDYLFDMSGGKGLIGVFASYSQADIKHKRGGTSRIGSTSVGLQLGYFADNGFYVDGILKYNNFDNDLRAISTNGYSVSGSYDRNAFGGSLEAGYAKEFSNGWFIEPYVKLTYFSVEGKTVHLSNGMKGKMSAYESLTSEIALTIGKTIKTEDVIWKPYVTAGWSYEFMDSNKVVINDLNQFNTNFTGSMGRIGVGVSAQLKSGFLIYGEVNYRAGRNVTAPVQANFGLRYQF